MTLPFDPAQIDIEEQIKEMEAKLSALKEKAEVKPIKVILRNVLQSRFTCSSVYRRDYSDFLATIGRKHDTVTSTDAIPLKHFVEWLEWFSKAENATVDYSEDLYKRAMYFLHGPDVLISLRNERGKPYEFVIKVKPEVDFVSVFGEMEKVILWKGNLSAYACPLAEAANLFKQVQDSVEWEPSAREYALNAIEKKASLADIAKLEYAANGDVKIGARELRPFQTVGVAYMDAIGYRGMIGDEMGLGKTLQGIASMLKADAQRIAVIVPATLRENWRREILACTGERAMMHIGTIPTPVDMKSIIESKTKWHIFNYDMFARPVKETSKVDGIFTTVEKYPWIDCINLLMFDAVLLDEAHKIKNISASRTKAILRLNVPKVICLTGTPILNRPGELWPALHLVAPEKFNNYEGFINRYTDGKNGARNVAELRELIVPYFIRRTKSQVMKDLPPIQRTTQYVELSAEDRGTYNKLMARIRVDLSTGDEVGQINSILEKILRVKQFLSNRKIKGVVDFCRDIYEQADPDDPYKKVIVFSQFLPVVNAIHKELGSESLYITGEDHSPIERQYIVDEFQRNPDKHYLICSTHAANEGLNITAAGHCIFNDFMWTPAAHQQAEGRAYGRLNDAHSIESHYFSIPNTLDDWLQELLQSKLATIEQVIEGTDTVRDQESSILKALFAAIRGGSL